MLVSYVSYLFVHGVDLERIKHLSIRQIDAMTKALVKKGTRDLIELASAMRMSQADGKDFKSWIKELERG